MKHHRLEFILCAKEPIAHMEGTIGNTQVVMRRKVVLPNGRMTKVPYITGDTMRHGLREAGTYSLLQAAGMLPNAGLSESAMRLLFSGGMVMGSASDVVRMDDARKWREVVPHIAILGGCIGNRIEPGKIEVGDAWLVCEESLQAGLVGSQAMDYLRDKEMEMSSGRAHIEMVQRVRMDPSLSPSKRMLLSDGEAARVEGRLLRSEAASEREDHGAKDREKSSMMPFSYETVIAGSLFAWRVDCMTHSEIEEDALAVMIGAFAQSMRVGGKKGTGHGLLEVEKVFGAHAPRTADKALEGVSIDDSDAVLRYLARAKENAPLIRKWLDEVKA